jgi:ketosteroid isomerase-like protein
MMTTAQVAVVKSFYDGLIRQDIAALESLLDVESLVIKEAASLPYGGEYHGLQGFRSLLAKLTESWAAVSFADFSYATGDDLVVAMFLMHATARATRQKTSFRVIEIWRFSAGKVVAIEPYYWDTHALLDTLGRR